MITATAITQFLRYLKFNGRSPLTVTNYHYDLEHLRKFCEKRKLEVQDVTLRRRSISSSNTKTKAKAWLR